MTKREQILWDAVKFYAEKKNWGEPTKDIRDWYLIESKDRGDKARKALAEFQAAQDSPPQAGDEEKVPSLGFGGKTVIRPLPPSRSEFESSPESLARLDRTIKEQLERARAATEAGEELPIEELINAGYEKMNVKAGTSVEDREVNLILFGAKFMQARAATESGSNRVFQGEFLIICRNCDEEWVTGLKDMGCPCCGSKDVFIDAYL